MQGTSGATAIPSKTFGRSAHPYPDACTHPELSCVQTCPRGAVHTGPSGFARQGVLLYLYVVLVVSFLSTRLCIGQFAFCFDVLAVIKSMHGGSLPTIPVEAGEHDRPRDQGQMFPASCCLNGEYLRVRDFGCHH